MAVLIEEREDAERDHLRRLGLWAGASILGGGALWIASTQETPLGAPLRHAEGFAVQSVAWGSINLTIAGLGLLFPSTTTPTRDAALAAEDDLAKILWTNMGLDVGYMMAGAVLVGVGSGVVDDAEPLYVSHGVGVMTQGLGLLVLDGIAVWSSSDREEALWALPASTTEPASASASTSTAVP